jgi:hypothetical protein
VLASIRKAVQALSPKEPKSSIDSSTKYYVAIGEAMNHTGRSDKQLDPVVRSAMQRAAARLRIFAVAPAGETARAAKQVMGSHKTLKAYFLLPKVLDPKYQSGDLRVAIEVTMFTYPTRALLGTYSLSLTQRSVPSKDPSAEAELVQMAAETAMEKFAGHVQSLP